MNGAFEKGWAAVSPARTLRRTGKALPADARAHNRAVVLQELFRGAPLSRADLARVTGLTRVTTSDVVGRLLDDGLVVEVGQREALQVGKPATLVALDASAACVIVLDLCQDEHFRGAVLDLTGTILQRVEVERRERAGEAAVDLVLDLAGRLVAAARSPVLGVGVGSPGVITPAGEVRDAANLGWHDLPLAARLGSGLGLPVHVANDANTATLAEHTFAGADQGGTLVVTIGRGVGAGLLVDGALLQGDRYAAGEIGHVVVDERGPDCACGNRGCLETYLSAPALRRILDRPDRDRALAAAGRRLGQVLAPVVSIVDLSTVIVNGPVDLLAGPLLDTMAAVIRARTMPVVADTLQVRRSELGGDAVLLGAAVLVLSGQLGVA